MKRLIENRMMVLVFWILLTASPTVHGVEDLNQSAKTLQILQIGFRDKPVEVQRSLLRDMALVNDEQVIPFFSSVALDPTYEDDTRRESLKAILALNSKKYRIMLDPLQTQPLDNVKVIQAIQMIGRMDLLRPFLSSLTFNEEKIVVEMKIMAILRFWNSKTIDGFDFSSWPSDLASQEIMEMIQSTKATGQKVYLIELWGKIRNERTTREMVKLLDQDSPKIQEALIFALSEPGPSAVAALGRFLQKSKNPILRKRAIFGLRRINNDTSKLALRSFLPQATADEKKWINEILKGM